jgi:transposase
MPNTATQLDLFDKRRQVPNGRGKGRLESTTSDRLFEIARLVSQGYKIAEIAGMLQLSVAWTRGLIKDARHKGLIDQFHEGRNRTTRAMTERREKVAERAFEIIQKRLNHVKTKKAADINARDVDDSFRALSITEHTAENKDSGRGTVVQTTGPVAIFSAEDLQKAAGVSTRILRD